MAEAPVHVDPEHTAEVHEDHPPAAPFDSDDVRSFQEDDSTAASVIGKMLVAFFFYSLIVMAIVAWWAYAVTQ